MIIAKKHTKLATYITLGLIILALTIALSWVYLLPTTNAADMKKFDPGNIMSDAVMSNKDSMSVQQIQSFLDSKNPCNNTNTHMANWYPHLNYTIRDGKFVCMAKDTFNGKSAAQIIWKAAQDYSINPQFIMVLLEKEQGLITDTWPNHVQYRTATGFGCPDTAACDSQYFGLENQIRNAANLFRTVLNGGWSNYPVGQTYVQYHPNTWCGGTVVNIQNRATSALYRYTPYQPNQSALNAGYGTGDSCGAYGNRNTYALFTDWFGSTQGYAWQPMEDSRWMRSSVSLQKTDLNTGKLTDAQINVGTDLKFIDKTVFNGDIYLRTEWDYINKISKGILLSKLTDINYEPITPEWKLINYNGVHKYIARQDRWLGLGDISAQYPIGTVVKVVDSITVNGKTSYRTEFDSIRGIDLALTDNRLSPITSIQPLEDPRSMQAKVDIQPVSMESQTCNHVKKHSILQIKGKVIINGGLYFSNKLSSTNIDGYCFIPADSLYWDVLKFTIFENPRQMKIISNVSRTDAYTGGLVDYLKSGQIVHFSSKIIVDGSLYYRTTYSGERNEPYIVPANKVVDF